MTTNKATRWVDAVFDSDLSSGEKLVCLYLRSFMHDHNDCAYPSISTIASKCGMGERSVYRHLAAICKAGYLTPNGHGPKGTVKYKICTPATVAPLPNETPVNVAPLPNETETPATVADELTNELTNTLSKGRARFVRPTVEQVRDHCSEKGYVIDPETFINHYNSNGWKVGGKAPMKCWKSTCATWNARELRNGNTKGHTRPAKNERRLSAGDRVRAAAAARRAGTSGSTD